MSELQCFAVLLAPEGQLSGDGQLRELIAERRERQGGDGSLWHLPADLVQALRLALPGQEAVVAGDPAVVTWLQLRFGGRIKTSLLPPTLLQERAAGLPPRAPQPPVALATKTTLA